MVRKIFIAAVFVVILCTSCMDNFLETKSPSIPSSENVFESTALTESALMGIYATMTESWMYGQKLCVNWQGVSDVEVGSNAFNASNYKATNSDSSAGNFYDDSYNSTTRWDVIYRFVEGATAAVDGIRGSSLLHSDKKATMEALLGEALTLKALGYFELIRFWGDVPFKSKASNSDLSNVYMEKVDRDTIYKYIVKDLQEAITYLPWTGKESYTVERVTKGFAKGLLARIALFAGGWSIRDNNNFPNLDLIHHPDIPELGGFFVGRPKNWEEYYKIAADQCADMLGDTENPHQLDPSFENIWKTVNHLELNKYNENLFEVAFGEGQSGDVGATMGYPLARGVFNASRGMGGGGYAATTMYYFYSFNRFDKRRDVTCVFQEYKNENGKNKEVFGCNPLGVACGKWRWYWMTDNYMKIRFPESTSRISTGINWILMRYSDVYLMFAEAQNALTGPDIVNEVAKISPRQALEKVRERAFGIGSPEISNYNSDFFTAIVNERAWEFGCEAIRRQDLARWGLLGEKIEEMKEALCLMYDNTQPVKIFDKIYQPEDFPKKIYYTYQNLNNEEYIDMSKINFYEDQGVDDPPLNYYGCDWIPMKLARNKDGELNETIHKDYASTMSKILVCGSGLYASYNYSDLFGKLRWGADAETDFIKYPIGNGVCNYRHIYAIYYEDIFESQGRLSNSYGFK
ncbi:RagB/SusD family nutrient uptake outer membrane protein [Bacteroides congonensis]